jgi:hypothetical protein
MCYEKLALKSETQGNKTDLSESNQTGTRTVVLFFVT